jgi:glucose-1-phosphate thymidylyltransferase
VRGLILTDASEPSGVPAFGRSPRELVPVANRPIVCHALSAMREAGVDRVVVAGQEPQLSAIEAAVGHDEQRFGDVEFVLQDEPGALSALRASAGVLDDGPFLVQFGDALLQDDLSPIVERTFSDPFDAIVLLRDRDARERSPLELEGARLLGALAGRGGNSSSGVSPTGFFLFGAGMAKAVGNLAAPVIGILSAVERLLEGGGRVETMRVESAWRYAGDPRRLLEANRFLLERLLPENTRKLDGVEVQGRVAVDPSADVRDSTIRGPAIIGSNARIRDAYIGPYTSIGPDVVVEGAEIEHSIVLPGATISHIGRRLETSIVGTGARLFRDFRLPNALRVQVGDGAEIALA